MFRCLMMFLLLLSVSMVNAKDDQEMPAMHHVFDVEPSAAISVPDDFPLNKKKRIDCQTCHGIKDMKQQDYEKIDKQSEDFLREGPYSQLSDFCYRCHEADNYQRDNVHKMLDDEGEIIESSCLYCHKKVLKPEDDIKRDEINLRLPAEKICYGCHLFTPHLNALAHQKKLDEKMAKRIRRYQQEHEIMMPLSDDGKVMCVTCHSAHPIDVIDRDKPAGKQVANDDLEKGVVYRAHAWGKVFAEDKKNRLQKSNAETGKNYVLNYQRIEKEILLRLPAKDGSLCLACHAFEK